MSKLLPAAEAAERLTQGVCAMLQAAFPDKAVKRSFASKETLLEQVESHGSIWVMLLEWSVHNPTRTRTGNKVCYEYGVFLAENVSDATWDTVWPVAKTWFTAYDALHKRLPVDCPGLWRRTVTGSRFGDRNLIKMDGGVFWGMISLLFEVKVR